MKRKNLRLLGRSVMIAVLFIAGILTAEQAPWWDEFTYQFQLIFGMIFSH
jgi:hypothetical protein